MWKACNGDTYMGEWKTGEVSGYGVHHMHTGQQYQGEFSKFLKHGYGK